MTENALIVLESLLGLFMLLLKLWWIWIIPTITIIVRIISSAVRRARLRRAGIAEVDGMNGVTFERYLAQLFQRLGYQVIRTPTSGDFGADLVIAKQNVRTVVQAKRYQKNVGVKAVQEVVAARDYYRGQKMLVVTNSGYTAQAQRLAKANNVELWDRQRLVAAILTGQKSQAKATAPRDVVNL